MASERERTEQWSEGSEAGDEMTNDENNHGVKRLCPLPRYSLERSARITKTMNQTLIASFFCAHDHLIQPD